MNRGKQRELIAAQLKGNPALSNREIAKGLEVSPTTVGTIRKELEEKGEMSKLDKLKGTGKEITLEASLNQLQEKIATIEKEILALKDKEKELKGQRTQLLADLALSPGDKYLEAKLVKTEKELRDIPRALEDEEGVLRVLKSRLSDVEGKIRVAQKGEQVKEYIEKEGRLRSLPGEIKALVDSLDSPVEDIKKLADDFCRDNIRFQSLKLTFASFMKKEKITALGGVSLEEIEGDNLKDTKDQVSNLLDMIRGLGRSLKEAERRLAFTFR